MGDSSVDSNASDITNGADSITPPFVDHTKSVDEVCVLNVEPTFCVAVVVDVKPVSTYSAGSCLAKSINVIFTPPLPLMPADPCGISRGVTRASAVDAYT